MASMCTHASARAASGPGKPLNSGHTREAADAHEVDRWTVRAIRQALRDGGLERVLKREAGHVDDREA